MQRKDQDNFLSDWLSSLQLLLHFLGFLLLLLELFLKDTQDMTFSGAQNVRHPCLLLVDKFSGHSNRTLLASHVLAPDTSGSPTGHQVSPFPACAESKCCQSSETKGPALPQNGSEGVM